MSLHFCMVLLTFCQKDEIIETSTNKRPNMKPYTQQRGEVILDKLDTVYDLLQATQGVPKDVLDIILKLQHRLENEFDEIEYQQGMDAIAEGSAQ